MSVDGHLSCNYIIILEFGIMERPDVSVEPVQGRSTEKDELVGGHYVCIPDNLLAQILDSMELTGMNSFTERFG